MFLNRKNQSYYDYVKLKDDLIINEKGWEMIYFLLGILILYGLEWISLVIRFKNMFQ